MAQIYEYAAGRELYQNDVDMMVTHLGEILTGLTEDNIITGKTSKSYIGFKSFKADGFGKYWDKSNQVRHFTGGFKFGYYDPILSRGVNTFRPDDDVDEALNTESTRIGRGLRNGDIPLHQLGQEIRRLGE